MDLNTNYSLQNTNSNYAIIVAGGSGSRMQSALPKQFLPLNGKPILMHTVEAFYNSASSPSIIIVLPISYHQYWFDLVSKQADFMVPHNVIEGGDTRFQSVKNGLELISDPDAVVAVHDAVRPLTSVKVIDQSFSHAAQYSNAVVAVNSRDSIRQVKNNISLALVRDEIYLVQTPQTFQSSLLRRAYQQPYSSEFTDDASVVERLGVNINIIEGSYTNIKITFPEDIAIAEMLLKQKSH